MKPSNQSNFARTSPERADGASRPRGPLWVGMAIAFVLTFLFRWVTVDFTNDQFTHLSRARQIVAGEWPIRDFFDPGQFLHYYVSAVAQIVFGYNLFGEALVTIGFVAIAAALTFALASRLARSLTIGGCVTLLSVLSFPRLYNYPKVFLYIAALGLGWSYANRPRRSKVVALAAFSAVAFLFRYDHGVYIGGFMVLLLAFIHSHDRGEALRAIGAYACVFGLLLVPFAAYVQWATGLPQYVKSELQPARMIRNDAKNLRRPSPVIDTSSPLLVVHPYTEERVTIRWKDSLDDPARRELETRHGLIDPVPEKDSWNYGLRDVRLENVQALLEDTNVRDAEGLSIEQLTPTAGRRVWRAIKRVVPFFRLSLAPGVLTPANALSTFYYMTIGIPLLALLMSIIGYWRGRIGKPEAAMMAAAACLGVVISRTLLADNPDARLGDIAAAIAVLGAWIAGRWLMVSPDHPPRPGVSIAKWVAQLIVFAVIFWSVTTQARIGPIARRFHLFEGPQAIRQQFGDVNRRLHLRPIDDWAPPDEHRGLPALGRWVWRCTQPDDRVLIVGEFAPEFFFFTDRLFAGGQVHFLSGWHGALVDQKLTINRLRHQSVPIVLEGGVEKEFARFFPVVAAYLHIQYIEAAQSAFNGDVTWRVLVDRRRAPVGTDSHSQLPCYRDPPVEE